MYIENIKITGLFKYLNYDIPLNSGINIIHGINGKGKTTILNIITNILNGDLTKFYYLSFKEILITFDNGYLKIYRDTTNKSNKINFDYNIAGDEFIKKDVKNTNSIRALLNRINIEPLLLPAQRVSIQETYHLDRELEYEYRYNRRIQSRDRFYRDERNVFQPNPKMVDILSIPREIIERARRFSHVTATSFSKFDNNLFEQFFEKTLFPQTTNVQKQFTEEAVVKTIDEIKSQKEAYFFKYKKLFNQSKILEKLESVITNDEIYLSDQIDSFLSLYLKNIKQKNKVISKYITPFSNLEKILNSLLDGKNIKISMNEEIRNIFKIFTEANDEIAVEHLSSGEKNLLLIFFHFLFEVKDNTLFMIDEPELSLHIDWQYSIIKFFQEYSDDNQIFVVTHSPDIMQSHREYEIDLDKYKFKA